MLRLIQNHRVKFMLPILLRISPYQRITRHHQIRFRNFRKSRLSLRPVQCQHLQLWRDVYYRDADANSSSGIRWAYAHGNLHNVATLNADEYFVLGDNSLMSLDARYWGTPVNLPSERLKAQAGVVPARFMLGKAFFVYWPAGHKPAGKGPIALVPNFGEMRFIR